MPYYRKWVCVELYVPVAVEAENDLLARQEVVRRCGEGFPFRYDRKKDLVRCVNTFPDDPEVDEIGEEEYRSIKTKL